MNDYKRFLMGCYWAVVKVRQNTDDLYNFCKLMESVGLKEDIEYFEKVSCDNRTKEEKSKFPYNREEDFCEDYFFHLAEINGIKSNEVCIEYQIDKGFTFGREQDYIDSEEDIKVLCVKDLIVATGKENEFRTDYKPTSFLNEMKNEEDDELATRLTDFCEWYGWELVKYPDKTYNLRDTEFTEDVFVGYFGKNETDTGTLRDCIKRVFERMVDYGTDEEEYETFEDVEKNAKAFIELGMKYNLMEDSYVKHILDWKESERSWRESERVFRESERKFFNK